MSSSDRAYLEGRLNESKERCLSASQSKNKKTRFDSEKKSCRNFMIFYVLIANDAAYPAKTHSINRVCINNKPAHHRGVVSFPALDLCRNGSFQQMHHVDSTWFVYEVDSSNILSQWLSGYLKISDKFGNVGFEYPLANVGACKQYLPTILVTHKFVDNIAAMMERPNYHTSKKAVAKAAGA